MSSSHEATFPSALRSLVGEFGASAAVHSGTYREDWVRSDYIEPLFENLGWRRLNPALRTTDSTGYVREVPLEQTGAARTPDYAFYVDGKRTFYVEAKKPSVNIRDDTRPALQIRDYGWSAGDDVGIVTDFEEFAFYNCRLQPQPTDRPAIGLIDYLCLDDYEPRWDWLTDHLTPSAVRGGSLRALVHGYKDKKRLIPVGSAFLAEIEQWRLSLARALVGDNSVEERRLGPVVQTLLDRIIFLRIAEARGLEAEGTLRGVLGEDDAYASLLKLFHLADVRYDSGLFHFRHEAGRDAPDSFSETLTVDDECLKPIIDRLTSPESPYRFQVISADILGQIYERFLGKELNIEHTEVVIEDKPEYRKSGGVYYTPPAVVEYIVDRTLGPLLRGKSVNQAKLIRIVDPACGSGSFLISAYQYLLDWYTEKYSKYQRPADRSRFLMVAADGTLRLRLSERKRILVDNIFGVDIDAQAVEVAKLSLLLKVIEGEMQTALQVDRLLPDLNRNIVCGNSLIGTDFYTTEELVNLTPAEAVRVNALDWADAFPSIAIASGFDAVIGNPPWLMAGYYVAESMEYFHRNYRSCAGKADLYYLFLEKSMRIANDGGRIGMIVPSKLFHTQAAGNLREMLSSGGWIEEIVDFGTAKLFEGATNYACILTMSRSNTGPVRVRRPPPHPEPANDFSVPRGELGRASWHLIEPERRELWARLTGEFPTLQSIATRFGNGVQSGADPILLLTESVRADRDIEDDMCRPVLRGRSVREFRVEPESLLIFPYREVGDRYELLSEADLESNFPGAHAYLQEHRRQLSARRWFKKDPVTLSGAWYGMMYLDELVSFKGPKIVSPALADGSNFAVDVDNLFVTGTAGVSSVLLPSDEATLRYFVLGLLNSHLLSEFITDHSTPYQGRYFKFSSPYLRAIPISMPDLALRAGKRSMEEIASTAEALSSPSMETRGRSALARRLNELVDELYGLSVDERACIGR